MKKRVGRQPVTRSSVFHVAAWALAAVCLAASLWLVLQAERRWAAARHASQSIPPPFQHEPSPPPSRDDTLADESPAKTAHVQAPIDAAELLREPPTGESRSTAGTEQVRHHLGAQQAAIQMVLFFDYECVQCLRVEQQVRALMARFPGDVSLWLRHLPQSTDCNHTLQLNAHPNACQAARAAEAAAILKGEAGFWEMHAWLFEHMGRFSADDLREALPPLGYDDVDGFMEIMDGEKPLERILRDVLDAATLPNVRLGTMVMNGIQLESGEIEDAMAQAVQFLEGQPPTDEPVASATESSPQRPFSIGLLARAMAATVQVVNLTNGDQGSGVMIAKRGSVVYLLTADHLLADKRRTADKRLLADRGDQLEIRAFSAIAANVPAVYRSVRVVARASDDDLAVLRFSTRQEVPALLPILPPRQIPAENPFPAVSMGWSGGAPTVVAGKVSAKKRVRKRSKGAATLMWELDKPSKPGQSGGPLIEPRGYVVGVASGNSGGHGYFCHTDVIHRLLDENGLKWLYTEKPHSVSETR